MSAHVLLDDNRLSDDPVDERLQGYRRKRRFTLTPEPPGGASQAARSPGFGGLRQTLPGRTA